LGLRERKKAATHAAIQAEAMRLFTDHGFEATTVEMVAAAANVSPVTCYRYFPTKESLVLSDDYDSLIVAGIQAQPQALGLADRVEAGVVAALSRLGGRGLAMVRVRLRLVERTPQLRARLWDQQARTAALLAAALGPADLGTAAVAAACLSVMTVAMTEWAARPEGEDPTRVLRAAFDGLRGAWSSTRPAGS
jgi:AcrR family transcriptional regulator